MKSSLILVGGTTLPFDGKNHTVEAVAVHEDRIHALGSIGEVNGTSGPGTRWIDCRGRAVLPGFHDAHIHIMASASRRIFLDCGTKSAGSILELKRLVSKKTGSLRKGEWVLGYGYDENHLIDKRHPTRHDLDAAAPYNPVRLVHQSGHACVLNSFALRLAGIRAETPEPDGVVIEREIETAEPNGILIGRCGWWEKGVLPAPGAKEFRDACRKFGLELSEHGITAVQDAGADNGEEQWQRLESMVTSDELRCRVMMMPGLNEYESCSENRLFRQVELGPVKIMLDEVRGYLNPPLDVLMDKVSNLYLNGVPLAIHAVEGGQIDGALNLLEALKAKFGPARALNRIEHCSIAPPAVLARIRDVGAAVVSHPAFIYYHGDRYLSSVNSADIQWLYPFSEMEKAGLTLAAASDSPMVPPDPLRGIAGAVQRRTVGGSCLNPLQTIGVSSSLASYTINAARVGAIVGRTGSLETGKDADLVVLDRNPLTCPLDEIEKVRVILTIFRGKIIYEAGDL